MAWRRAWSVATKEWAEILRDRLFLALAFIVPPALMLIFGFGLNMDVENIPFVVVDYDRSPVSRDYAYRFIDSRYFDFKGYLIDERRIRPLISRNEIRAAIIIPEDFSERLQAGRPVAVQTILDGMIPLRAKITSGYIAAINGAVTREKLADFLSRSLGMQSAEAYDMLEPIRVELRYMYNQGAKSIWSLAPKMVMLVLMMTPPLLTAVGVVREKERGSILNIYGSSVSRGEFLLGKIAPYVLIAFLNGLLLWAMALGIFGAPFTGSPAFFTVATAAFALCTAGIGLLVSIFVRTQIAAIVVTMIITLIPALLYSGVLIPLSSMGASAQALAYLVPAMHYAIIIDGSFLKGIGVSQLWPQLLALFLYAAVLFAAAYALFTKRPAS